MRPVEAVLRMGGGQIRENNGGVNLTKIYYRHLCKCYSVPPEQQYGNKNSIFQTYT
jgi:hypothetical protein